MISHTNISLTNLYERRTISTLGILAMLGGNALLATRVLLHAITTLIVEHQPVKTTNINSALQKILGQRKENMNKNIKLRCKNCGYKETLENVTQSMNTKILIAQVTD